jgi:hypothetical protein
VQFPPPTPERFYKYYAFFSVELPSLPAAEVSETAADDSGSYNRLEAQNARTTDTIQIAAEVIASALP